MRKLNCTAGEATQSCLPLENPIPMEYLKKEAMQQDKISFVNHASITGVIRSKKRKRRIATQIGIRAVDICTIPLVPQTVLHTTCSVVT